MTNQEKQDALKRLPDMFNLMSTDEQLKEVDKASADGDSALANVMVEIISNEILGQSFIKG